MFNEGSRYWMSGKKIFLPYSEVEVARPSKLIEGETLWIEREKKP